MSTHRSKHTQSSTNPARRTLLALLALLLFVALSGCEAANAPTGDPSDDSEPLSVAQFALTADDEDDGGFGEGVDATAIEELLDHEAFTEDTVPATDEVDPEVQPEPTDAIVRTVVVLWGQPTYNPNNDVVVEWKGFLGSNVARVHVLRKIRFEKQDHLLPEGDPNRVAFRSVTLPHNDGLLLRVVIPRRPESLLGTFSFKTTHYSKTIALADLIDGYHETFKVDGMGNVLRILSAPPRACAHGVMRAHWKRLSPRGGVFGGIFMTADGNKRARVVGLWGHVQGKRRIKGMIVGADGSFLGVLRGTYRPFPAELDLDGGHFRAHWRLKDKNVRGILRGTYVAAPEGGHGRAYGVWGAVCRPGPKACSEELSLPTPKPECGCAPDAENADASSAEPLPTCSCKLPPKPSCIDAEVEPAPGDPSMAEPMP